MGRGPQVWRVGGSSGSGSRRGGGSTLLLECVWRHGPPEGKVRSAEGRTRLHAVSAHRASARARTARERHACTFIESKRTPWTARGGHTCMPALQPSPRCALQKLPRRGTGRTHRRGAGAQRQPGNRSRDSEPGPCTRRRNLASLGPATPNCGVASVCARASWSMSSRHPRELGAHQRAELVLLSERLRALSMRGSPEQLLKIARWSVLSTAGTRTAGCKARRENGREQQAGHPADQF
jgi:hypothetical protein